MFSGKTIFIAALDWGLGHSTRTAALAKRLEEKNTLVFGVTKLNRDYFQKQFPSHLFEELPSYGIWYSRYIPLWLALLLQWTGIKRTIKREHAELKKIGKKHSVEVVISDSRYGLYNHELESVLISHQLKIKAPVFGAFVNKVHLGLMNCFDQVWVPDHELPTKKLAGELSIPDQVKVPVKFIGPLSLWKKIEGQSNEPSHILVLLSGVEPQRSLLEAGLVKALGQVNAKITFVRGNGEQTNNFPDNWNVLALADAEQLSALAGKAGTVICRSGYSSLMDLNVIDFKGKLILIPTPGQTEQLSLATHWQKNFGAFVMQQNKINRSVIEQLLRIH